MADKKNSNAIEKRRELIKSCVFGNNTSYNGINLEAEEFLTDSWLLNPETPDGDVCSAIHNYAVKKYEELQGKQAADASNAASEPAPEQQATSIAPEEERALMLLIEYPASRSEEVKAAAMTLKSLCTNFLARKTGRR